MRKKRWIHWRWKARWTYQKESCTAESGNSEEGGFESQWMRRDVQLLKNNMRNTVRKLQVGQQRQRVAADFRNLYKDFDYVIHNYHQHIERWRETLQIIEDPYRNRAVDEGRQPAASSCSSKERPSSDPAADIFELVALLGFSIFLLYRILK
ncbi:hypothetical protein CEXT_507031 [Caerostris extrusa]|uniref:Uncharacterized protein n=1 Tax=Caerostris extrusa TaxID=172846 RepID=A0AAV4P5V9_CAEEX|nr:hypothetical protein CEXT_507031 [Caerostris extrusa]